MINLILILLVVTAICTALVKGKEKENKDNDKAG